VFFKLNKARLARAYLDLVRVPWNLGSRSVRLAQFGAYEVRLVEFEDDNPEMGSSFWLELYQHETCESLDACDCDEFDAAARTLDEFMVRATELHRANRA
jgi:hypothetical protein